MPMNFLSFDIPSVEKLMKNSLANFRTFSTNDCGYSGSTKDLIVNWVHPLFPKAKQLQTGKNNPTWWEAMNGCFGDEYWKDCG